MNEAHALSPELAQWIDAKFEALKQDIHDRFIVLTRKVLADEVGLSSAARDARSAVTRP